ncbi:MAG: hypothetical protein ACYDGR_04290, partial [Candidatus Dormibacteria bacterium]
IRRGTVLEGSVQLVLGASDVRVDSAVVFRGLENGLPGRTFTRVRLVPDQFVWMKESVDLRVYMWFPPRSNTIEMVVLRRKFTEHRQLVRALVDYQHGRNDNFGSVG